MERQPVRNILLRLPRITTLLLGFASTALAQGPTGDETLALANGRFQITAAWQSTLGSSGLGHAVTLTNNTGYFWFFDDSNLEVFVKVLDACGVSDREWVFAGGLTNTGVSLTVRDTVTGTSETYTNPIGTPFLPLQDTATFRCSAEQDSGPLTGEWTGTFDSADVECAGTVPASATFQQRGSAVEGYITADERGCGAVRARFEGTLRGSVLDGTIAGGIARFRFHAGSTAHGTLMWESLDLNLVANGNPPQFHAPGGALHLQRR